MLSRAFKLNYRKLYVPIVMSSTLSQHTASLTENLQQHQPTSDSETNAQCHNRNKMSRS